MNISSLPAILLFLVFFVAGGVRVAAQSEWELTSPPVVNGNPVGVMEIVGTPSGTLFLRTNDQGLLYRSLNMGETWEPAANGIEPSDMAGASVYPSPSGALFLFSPLRATLYHSANNGGSWLPVLQLAGDDAELRHLAFTSQGGIYVSANDTTLRYSADDGKTWSLLAAPANGAFVSVTTNGDLVAAATSDFGKAVVWRSEGGTGAWQQVFTGGANSTTARLFLNPQTNILFIGVTNVNNGTFASADIFCSVDFGVSWQIVNTGIATDNRRIISHIVTPDGNLHILIGTGVIYTLPFMRAEWEQRTPTNQIGTPQQLASIGHTWFVIDNSGKLFRKNLTPTAVEMEPGSKGLPLDLW